jgi:hypothetical protein
MKTLKEAVCSGVCLLEGNVSFDEASQVLSPKHFFLVEGGIRSYTIWYARMLMTIDKE